MTSFEKDQQVLTTGVHAGSNGSLFHQQCVVVVVVAVVVVLVA